MKKDKMPFISVGAILLLCTITTYVDAQSFSLRKVVDTNTPIPSGSGKFSYFLPMAISGDNVAFEGEGSSGQHGIYLFNGITLIKVADRNTPIPGGIGNFGWLAGPVISGGNVAFMGGVGSGGAAQEGIYLFSNGTLSKVVDYNTPIPGGVANFTDFVISGISGNTVVFWGHGGIYTFDGITLRVVVDINTPAPGGSGSLGVVELPVISGTNIAFIGADSLGLGQRAVYLWNSTNLSKLVDCNTPVPGGVGNFTHFDHLAISGGNVAFWGWDSYQYGIYLFSKGILSKVVDPNTPVPGGIGTFGGFDFPEIGGDNVAVRGMDSSGYHGIYIFNGIVLSKVADRSTPVPEGTGNFRDISHPKISGGNIVFDAADSLAVNHGVYLFNSSILTKVADSNTPIPDGSGKFTAALSPEISGGSIAFVGGGASGQLGIYLANPQSLQGLSIPTLTEWGIIIMSVLLGGSGVCLLKKRRVV